MPAVWERDRPDPGMLASILELGYSRARQTKRGVVCLNDTGVGPPTLTMINELLLPTESWEYPDKHTAFVAYTQWDPTKTREPPDFLRKTQG